MFVELTEQRVICLRSVCVCEKEKVENGSSRSGRTATYEETGGSGDPSIVMYQRLSHFAFACMRTDTHTQSVSPDRSPRHFN